MLREEIDEFLNLHKDIAATIERISKQYVLSDFVKADEACKQYFENKDESNIGEIHGCLYNEREKRLRLDIESPDSRLTIEYMELLTDVISIKEDINKVFYIVAYHYLTLCKQLGYKLTEADRAPFPFMGPEMSPLAKRNYKKYEEFAESRLDGIVYFFSEEELLYYNTIYRECGYHHHATKHFSLIGYLLDLNHTVNINRYRFDYGFDQILDAFVFRYKAIYTVERLGKYMFPDTKERIMKSLADIEE